MSFGLHEQRIFGTRQRDVTPVTFYHGFLCASIRKKLGYKENTTKYRSLFWKPQSHVTVINITNKHLPHCSVHFLLSSSFPQRTCKPLESRVSYPCSLSPQFDYHYQRFHSWVTLGETFQKEGIPHAGPVLHADIGFKRLLSVFEFDDRHSGVRYHLNNRRQLNIARWKTLQLLHERGSMRQSVHEPVGPWIET